MSSHINLSYNNKKNIDKNLIMYTVVYKNIILCLITQAKKNILFMVQYVTFFCALNCQKSTISHAIFL
jgi:hypothetical protein